MTYRFKSCRGHSVGSWSGETIPRHSLKMSPRSFLVTLPTALGEF